MEEQVGESWHKIITRMETTRHQEAAVTLNDVNCMASCSGRLAVMAGFQIEAANATQHGARRGLLDRIARSNKQVELAWRDDQSLHLPAIIDYFPECNSIKTSIPDWQPAHIALRIPPEKLPEAEATQENAIRQALLEPGSCHQLPATRRPPQPMLPCGCTLFHLYLQHNQPGKVEMVVPMAKNQQSRARA